MAGASTDGRVLTYPTNRVVGTVGNAENARAAIDALLKAGFDTQDIDLLHGEEDVKRLDPTGAGHGFLAQFQRTLIRTFELEEFKHLMHHVEDVRAGRYVIMVLTRRRGQRVIAGDILHQHGAEFVGFYGRWAWEGIPGAAPKSPEDLAVAFVRAWNSRDLEALGALFDEDAEFVNVTGLCWHNRGSIRSNHANGFGNVAPSSTLVMDEVKVKLLATNVAVVHARFSCSGDAPRSTMAMFVVHRVGEQWLCASAQTTDVVPATGQGMVAS